MRELCAIQHVRTNVFMYRDEHREVKGKRSAEAMTQSLEVSRDFFLC